MSKAKTKEELREEFLNSVRGIVQYWLDAPDMDEKVDVRVWLFLCLPC